MLTDTDRHWLNQKHPGIRADANGVEGAIEFTAAYDATSDLFQLLDDSSVAPATGLVLKDRYAIRIQERTTKLTSNLPALYVAELEPIADRHFSPLDKSACLCSSLEEHEFLLPEFRFTHFLEGLVIPFLYGQTFYSLNRRWPWSEYAHGAVGLLEAYSRAPTPENARHCLKQLEIYPAWRTIQSLLHQKWPIKGHIACFCATPDHIRRCHPQALAGIRRLQQDINFCNA